MTILIMSEKATKARRGFTLIELLIVVAIIAILAAIAVPNFLEAQTRAKVSRVRNDHRTVVTAFESYYVDYNSYPNRATGGNSVNAIRGWINLTTPVAYITGGLMADPFVLLNKKRYTAAGQQAYQFTTGSMMAGSNGEDRWPRTCFLILSNGPDWDDDTDIGSFPRVGKATPYDTTNGTKSNGDIYRLQCPVKLLNFESELNPLPPYPWL